MIQWPCCDESRHENRSIKDRGYIGWPGSMLTNDWNVIGVKLGHAKLDRIRCSPKTNKRPLIRSVGRIELISCVTWWDMNSSSLILEGENWRKGILSGKAIPDRTSNYIRYDVVCTIHWLTYIQRAHVAVYSNMRLISTITRRGKTSRQ